jgi:1-acyl-sn-glycerol-3-phosphate acyltransferase
MKPILARIYFFYILVLFALSILPTFIGIIIIKIFFREPAYSNVLHTWFQIWMGYYLPMIGCPVSYKGRHFFEKNKNYVVVCNHNTLFDVPVSSPGIPFANRTLAKVEFSKIPIFGTVYKSNAILLSRDDMKSRVESFKKMKAVLDQGLNLCLYPEGTRNKTDMPIARFYDGAFIVAIEAQKPIIPALIFNTKKLLDTSKKYWAWPHKLEFHFLEPIPTIGLKKEDAAKLRTQVYELMKNYYVKNNI